MNICYIGLGSNLQNPQQQLQQAKNSIQEMPETELIRCSSIYKSRAITLDDEPQNDYFNAVVEIKTDLSADHLLDELQKIEALQGRIREKRWGARTIDLDILLFADSQISTPRLTVPHAEMQQRNFVLFPLHQLVPELSLPGSRTLKELLPMVEHQLLEKMGDFND